MWFLCDFEYIEKYYHQVYMATITGICVGSQEIVRVFSANPMATQLKSVLFYENVIIMI